MTAQLSIESDGTAKGTRVLVDGKELEGVAEIHWNLNAETGYAAATLRLFDVAATVNMTATDKEEGTK